mmetsp:Transcript_72527/g.130575  ORF Transcript_72527/g.130575 Transcript_72527/m.130575 type:complete len:212 (-) Transcript_72527:738-1373(-)
MLAALRVGSVHFQAYSQGNCLVTVGDLVTEAWANDHRGSVRQGLGEAVLTAVRQEKIHASSKNIDLGQERATNRIGWWRQAIQSVCLSANCNNNQRTFLGIAGPKCVEGSGPSSLAELFARQASRLPIFASWPSSPTPEEHVPCHNCAHADQHYLPACNPSSLDLGQDATGSNCLHVVQQWPHCNQSRSCRCIVAFEVRAHWVFEVFQGSG